VGVCGVVYTPSPTIRNFQCSQAAETDFVDILRFFCEIFLQIPVDTLRSWFLRVATDVVDIISFKFNFNNWAYKLNLLWLRLLCIEHVVTIRNQSRCIQINKSWSYIVLFLEWQAAWKFYFFSLWNITKITLFLFQ